MAKADQKVTTPQPIWIFLWVFAYAPIRQDFNTSDLTVAKSKKQLETLEGGTALANLSVQ